MLCESTYLSSYDLEVRELLTELLDAEPHRAPQIYTSKIDISYISVSPNIYGEGNGNPLQYSCLENPMDGGVWRATVHGITRVGHNLVTKPPPSPPNI